MFLSPVKRPSFLIFIYFFEAKHCFRAKVLFRLKGKTLMQEFYSLKALDSIIFSSNDPLKMALFLISVAQYLCNIEQSSAASPETLDSVQP